MKTNVIGLVLTLLAVIVFAGTAPSARADADDKLAGTWRVTETFSDNTVSNGLITFQGTGNEGTLISSFDASLSSPHPCLPEQGTWKKSGHSFTGLDEGFCYTLADSNLGFFAKVTATYRFTLSANGHSFSGTGTLLIPGYVDPAETYTITGVRQPVQP
jgi:hypothetical protein